MDNQLHTLATQLAIAVKMQDERKDRIAAATTDFATVIEDVRHLAGEIAELDMVIRAYDELREAEQALKAAAAAADQLRAQVRECASQAAPVLLPTLPDKTLLRGANGRAAITVAVKHKTRTWNPLLAFQLCDQTPALQHFIVRQVDADRFQEAVQKGQVALPQGVYEFDTIYEARITEDNLRTLAEELSV